MEYTIARSKLEEIKANIKRIRVGLKHLNPLLLDDLALAERYKFELKLYAKSLESYRPLRLIKTT